jgi:SpoVK/Ycf46/Vps4 family AAA+-type ATPase
MIIIIQKMDYRWITLLGTGVASVFLLYYLKNKPHYVLYLSDENEKSMTKYINDKIDRKSSYTASVGTTGTKFISGRIGLDIFQSYGHYYRVNTCSPETLFDNLKQYQVNEPIISESPVRMKHIYLNGKWRRYGEAVNRSFDSVFLSNENRLNISQAMKIFEESDDPARSLGIIIKGNQGTGKTSLINSIATSTRRSPYYLNAENMSNAEFLESLMDIPVGDAVIVMERIEKINKSTNSEVYHQVLDLLDGELTRPDQIVILTTENPNELDDNLTRDGRIHLTVALETCTSEIISQIYEHYELSTPLPDDMTKIINQKTPPVKLIYALEHGAELGSIIRVSLDDKN